MENTGAPHSCVMSYCSTTPAWRTKPPLEAFLLVVDISMLGRSHLAIACDVWMWDSVVFQVFLPSPGILFIFDEVKSSSFHLLLLLFLTSFSVNFTCCCCGGLNLDNNCLGLSICSGSRECFPMRIFIHAAFLHQTDQRRPLHQSDFCHVANCPIVALSCKAIL